MIRIISLILLIAVVLLALAVLRFRHMPGRSFSGQPYPFSREMELQEEALRAHIRTLAHDIGVRNVDNAQGLERARDYIAAKLKQLAYAVREQEFHADEKSVQNFFVELPGSVAPRELLVVGAHYDSVNCPGANDNGSGVAVLLELARRLKSWTPEITLRLVFFVNEESPYGLTPEMGSYKFAASLVSENWSSVSMISLETIGYYTDEPNSQRYPFPLSLFYPSRGNFAAFVGNSDSAPFVREAIAAFRAHAHIPSEGIAAPSLLRDAARSDHWSFWQFGYPALMITDTAPFRYPHYHLETDTADKLSFTQLTRLTAGLEAMVRELSLRGAH